jgi:hypothetical protein
MTRALMTTLMAVAALAIAGAAFGASPRTISNIATISWDAGGVQLQQSSNRVDLDVTVSSDTAGLTTWRLSHGSAQTVALGACGLQERRRDYLLRLRRNLPGHQLGLRSD